MKALSRETFFSSLSMPSHQELRSGAIQRIADATELMAREYQRLLRDKVYWEKRATEERLAKERLLRSNAALRAWITRLKRKIK